MRDCKIQNPKQLYREGEIVNEIIVRISSDLWVNEQADLVGLIIENFKARLRYQRACSCRPDKKCHECKIQLAGLNEILYKHLDIEDAYRTNQTAFEELFKKYMPENFHFWLNKVDKKTLRELKQSEADESLRSLRYLFQ